uniref:Uncharacterized protein n=1 Tax=Tanacetum cinerariifolium TaxID=118510 RepID=A0A6L2JDA0_TANCI|nr:hypothetical protein [Tanacetum cinerariifolium]
MADTKEMWEAIKSRFGGNDESKKMQKYLLKQQFEGFSVSTSKGLHKGYDRFQTLLSQLKIHGAGVLHEDANQKFLRVFECDVKGTNESSSNTHNVAFLSADNTSNTNDVSTAYSVSSPFVLKSQIKGSSSYTDEVIHSFFANQSSAPQLDYDDLEQINDDDMEEMDLKWIQLVLIRPKWNASIAIKWSILLETAELKGTKIAEEEMLEDIDWSVHVEEDTQNYAMMAYSSSNLGSDNEVQSCSKTCAESYARLKRLHDEQRDKLGDASVEITAYTLALKKKLLAEALKEKEDLKTKFENWQNSSKNLSRMLNTQMSTNDKFGLGYGDYRYGSILSYENKVLQSVFMNKKSDLEDTSVNDRYVDGMHAVPLPMIGNYMPFGPDVEIDYSKFTYGPKQTSVVESDSKPSEYASCKSDSNVETPTSMLKPIDNAPKVVCAPKVWTDAPIIEEYESDSDDDSVSNVQKEKEKPSFAFTDTAKHVKTSRENVKETCTPNHIPKIENQDRNSHTRKAQRTTFSYHKVSAVKGNWDTAVKASAGYNWRNKRNPWNKVFNYNSGSKFRKNVKDPLGNLKSEMAWVPKRN